MAEDDLAGRAAPSPTPALALRPREAARAIGISERLLWSRTRAGEIPHVRVGRCVLYPVAALEQWLAEQVGRDKP